MTCCKSEVPIAYPVAVQRARRWSKVYVTYDGRFFASFWSFRRAVRVARNLMQAHNESIEQGQKRQAGYNIDRDYLLTRVEVIDGSGRAYTYSTPDKSLRVVRSYQDNEKTLKIFVGMPQR